MKPVWKWLLVIVAVLILLAAFGTPLMMAQFYPFGGYGMMAGPWFGGHMPMHYGYGGFALTGGYGWMGVGLFLGVLIQLGLLVLIVLGIVWLVRAIARQNQ